MAKQGDIALGDEVKDDITGLRGIVVCVSDFLNGCQRIAVQPKQLHEGKPVDPSSFDTEQLVLIKAAKPAKATKTGGTRPDITRRAHDRLRPERR